jgi:hypothetical protein
MKDSPAASRAKENIRKEIMGASREKDFVSLFNSGLDATLKSRVPRSLPRGKHWRLVMIGLFQLHES